MESWHLAPGSVNASSVQGPQQSGHPCPSQSLLTLVSVALTMSPDPLVSLMASLLSICPLEGKLPVGRDLGCALAEWGPDGLRTHFLPPQDPTLPGLLHHPCELWSSCQLD